MGLHETGDHAGNLADEREDFDGVHATGAGVNSCPSQDEEGRKINLINATLTRVPVAPPASSD